MSGVPDPTHFSDGTPVPPNTGPQYPGGTGGGAGTSGFTQDQMNAWNAAIQSNPDLAGVWQTVQNTVGDAWGWLKDHFGNINWSDLGTWLKNNAGAITQAALAAGSAVNSYQRQQQSDKYAKQALDLATQEYATKAPLRAAGQAGMLDPHAGTPNLSSLSAQGQQGASMLAPLPMAPPQTAYQNAASVAGNNPFTKGLPMAPAPVSGTPNVPGQSPGGPSAGPSSFAPKTPTPLPLGPPQSVAPPIPAPTPGQGRSVYDGPNNGQPPPAPTTVPPIPAPAPGQGRSVYDGPNNGQPTPPVPAALQLAPQSGAIANGPQNRTLPTFPTGLPRYSAFSPLPLAGS